MRGWRCGCRVRGANAAKHAKKHCGKKSHTYLYGFFLRCRSRVSQLTLRPSSHFTLNTGQTRSLKLEFPAEL